MRNLLLTLGHNSSAIMVEDNRVVWGYETERVTGVKSDSRFPSFVLDFAKAQRPDMIYATHWAPNGRLDSIGHKYWQPGYFDGIPVRTLNADNSHHDTHMAAALCYAGPHFPYMPGTIGVVVDGFGIYGEHLSVYDLSGPTRLLKRYRGYGTSMGLWYQYATAFMGLKMHEDEYKLLGYEVRISASDRARLDTMASDQAVQILDDMRESVYGSQYDPVFSLDALAHTKQHVFEVLSGVCTAIGITDSTTYESRIKLAYYVQAVLEHVVLCTVAAHKPKHLILSGGVFYNVKLNKLLLDSIDGFVCVYPLAGDQGNAIGLYSMDHPHFTFPIDLNWGVRELKNVGQVPNLHVVTSSQAERAVTHYLERYGFVNLVRDNMEFGPRAMCNTSTLAIPKMPNVHAINNMNDRNTVMPMAPVMTLGMYHNLYKHSNRVWRSQRHMVIAMEYLEQPEDHMLGVAHEYQFPYHHFTGRPQVAQDKFMIDILNGIGHPLINTSFNFHGMPIALGMESIIKNHMMQLQRCPNIHTVVIQNDE